jgi:ABC-type branched-subunit amino acid transport system substrate-binding protein
MLVACSPNKDISRDGKIPASSIGIDEFFDPSLRLFDQRKNSVLLILPMSGSNEPMGKSILNACFLAAEDSSNINFYVIDSANPSMEKLSEYGKFRSLKAVVGPIFSHEVNRYGALFPNIPVFSLSNDLKINNGHVFACGLSLQDEIQMLFSYANSQNIDSFLIMIPEGEFGNQILEVVGGELKKYSIEEGDDLEIIRYASISRKAATKYAKNSSKKAVLIVNPILNTAKLDAQVFTLSSVALSNPEIWNGAIFAFSNSPEQKEFMQKYRSIFGTFPKILDMTSYDLTRVIKESMDSGKSIMGNNYRGCLGEFSIDKKNGLRRQLKIFRLENSQMVEVEYE